MRRCAASIGPPHLGLTPASTTGETIFFEEAGPTKLPLEGPAKATEGEEGGSKGTTPTQGHHGTGSQKELNLMIKGTELPIVTLIQKIFTRPYVVINHKESDPNGHNQMAQRVATRHT